MVHQLMRASSSRTLLRPCLSSHASTSTAAASCSRSYSSSSTSRSLLLARSRTSTGLSFPSLTSSRSSAAAQFQQRRNISLFGQGGSPVPIRGEDGKVHKAGDLETAQAASSNAPASTSATPLTPGTSASASPVAPATATSSTPVPAPGEVTNQVSNAASTVADSTTSAAAPHTVSLETIPVELSESIGATRRTLQEYGLGNSTPSGWVQGALEWVHLTTGLPWWATIGATVIIVRMTLFPLMVRGISNNARLATIQPRLMANIATLKKAQKDGDTVKVQKLQMETRQLFMDNDCGPLRGLILPLVQMPLFVSFFFALRGMANAGLPDFATGGVAWFTNLSVPDPTYILPVISAAATLAVLQVGEYGAPPKQGAMKGVMSVFKLATPLVAWVASSFPAAVLVYWVTHNSFSVLQALVLKIPAFKRWANIPDPPKTPANQPTSGVGFMQAFKDAKDAFAEVSENASAKTEEQEAEKEQQKAAKIVEDDKAKRKADTLARLRSNRPQRDLHRPSKNEIARRNRGLQNKKHIE